MNGSRLTRRILCLLLLAALWALIAVPAFGALAQSGGGYGLTWSTIGGGGESAGGGFTLAGTIGQAGAGALAGGPYTLAGGFWPGAGANYLRFLPVVMK